MAYATIADLTSVGLPASALGNLTAAQINAELQAASDFADGFFRARWGTAALPLADWDSTVTRAVAQIAAVYLLRVRGYAANSTADQRFQTAHDEAVAWLGQVQRQQAHPKVTLANETSGPNPSARLQQPSLITSSVVNLATGATGRTRGW